jgi:hypothetical protein
MPLAYIVSHPRDFVKRKMQKFAKKSFFDKIGGFGGEMGLNSMHFFVAVNADQFPFGVYG